MSLIKHSLWAVSSGILMTSSRFILTAVLARRMGVESFGVYAYSQWLVDISFLICTFGATGVVSRYLSEFRHNQNLMVAIVRAWRPVSVLLPAASGVVAVVSASLSGVELDEISGFLLASWGLASGLWGMHTAALVGLQRFDLIFKANFIAAGVMLIGAVFIPLNGSPIPIFFLMTLASTLAALVGLKPINVAGCGTTEILSAGQRHVIYRFAVNIWITTLMWSLVWSRGEVPFVRWILGDTAVAHYAVALTLYGGAVAGVMLGVSGIGPQITRYLGVGKTQSAISLCRKAMDLQLLLSGLAALTLIWLGADLMRWSFGVEYLESVKLLSILALGLPALTVASHNHLLQIETDALYNRNTTFLGLILLVLLAWMGVSKFGLVGAAWARVATLLVLGAITTFVCWRRWGNAAIGLSNVLGVGVVSLLALLANFSSQFEAITLRFLGLLVSSLAILFWVRDESNRLVVPLLVVLVRSRFLRKN